MEKGVDALFWLGLSPLARGNRIVAQLAGLVPGPIPACAGEPIAYAILYPPSGAYPRLRGGTSLLPARSNAGGGLSPLARGNRGERKHGTASLRPIPACAGEPGLCLRHPDARWAYPRLRGGTTEILGVSWPSMGLSPLARGNPDAGLKNSLPDGPIPACAGEPPTAWR